MNAFTIKTKKTKGVSPCKLVVTREEVVGYSRRWWWSGLISSVGNDIQHRSGRDVMIHCKTLVAVNALSMETRKQREFPLVTCLWCDRRLLACGQWWWRGLIPSVGNDIKHCTGRDVTI